MHIELINGRDKYLSMVSFIDLIVSKDSIDSSIQYLFHIQTTFKY